MKNSYGQMFVEGNIYFTLLQRMAHKLCVLWLARHLLFMDSK